MKISLFSALSIAVILSQGCATRAVYNHNKQQAYKQMAVSAQNNQLLKASYDGEYYQFGVDLTMVETVFRNWKSTGLQSAAMLIDVGTAWVTVEGVKWIKNEFEQDNNQPIIINNYIEYPSDITP